MKDESFEATLQQIRNLMRVMSPSSEEKVKERLDEFTLQRIRNLLRLGQTEEAEAIYRETEGCSADRARQVVAALKAKISEHAPLPQDLLDTAYDLSRSFRRNSFEQQLSELARLLPGFSAEEYLEAVRLARELFNAACHFCDLARDGKMTEEEASSMIKKTCPGFSAEICGWAYGDGMMATR